MVTSVRTLDSATRQGAPIAFFVFRRPEQTARVFEQIRAWRPRQLFVIADGPRHPGEEEDCASTREIATAVDWPCEVKTNFADANLGCRRRISSGLDWVFSRAEEAIVLEDDCLPHPDFFNFCASMLKVYRDDKRVMMITGTNLAGRWHDERQDLHFSLYGSIWGWATWSRAWRHYEVRMKGWGDIRAREAIRHLFPRDEAEAREIVFDAVAEYRVDTWDYQWTFARLLQSGLCIVPSRNLIRNIGFGAGATHTSETDNRMDAELHPHPGPYRPAISVVADRAYDRYQFENGGCGAGGNERGLRRAVARIGRAWNLEAARLRNLFSEDWKQW